MKKQTRAIVTNPVTIILPIVFALLVGWHFYTQRARSLSVPSGVNMLRSGSFDMLDSHSMPPGWNLNQHGELHYATERTRGYVSGGAFELRVTNYKNGDVTFESPKVSLEARETYLYKGFYAASGSFELVGRYFYKDGSVQSKLLQTYPATTTGTWSTVADAFSSGDDIAAVQYVYHITSNILLSFDATYLEQDTHVYVSPLPEGENLIPNGSLSASRGNAPTAWSTYHAGDNQASFSYQHSGTNAYIAANVSNFKNGEAKWQYEPLQVHGDQHYEFTVDYQATAGASIVAEYVLKNGKHQFADLATLTPTTSWTTVRRSLDVPPAAVNVFVSVVLHSAGGIATDNYTLINATKPGNAHWNRPLISLTFDDGWHSTYQNAVPILAQYHYTGTFYINPATVETKGFMTDSELNSLRASGEEIASHGFMHLDMTTLNQSALEHQLYDGKTYLQQAGFPTEDFAVPYGKLDPEVSWYARKYYGVVRGTDDGINTRQNFDAYNLKVLYVNSDMSQEKFDAALQQTRDTNGWLVIVYHQIGTASKTPDVTMLRANAPTISTDDFLWQMVAIKRSGMTVETVKDAYKELQSQ